MYVFVQALLYFCVNRKVFNPEDPEFRVSSSDFKNQFDLYE